jgi:uncharacterized protein (TIGR00106 family)
MKIIADICVIPLHTASPSVREEVAIAHQILLDTGCDCNLHAYGTNIAGDYDIIMSAIKKIHLALHERGIVRIHTNLKIGSRTDKAQSLQDKTDAVCDELTSKK